jgi:hypothetical protein
MQFVYASMNFLRTPLSFYATGDLWFVVSSGLMMIGVSYCILAFQYVKNNEGVKIRIRIGSSILFLTGICTFLLTIFQTDTGYAATMSGRIHVVAAHLHFILLPIAILCISFSLNGRQWKRYKVYSITFSYVLIGTGLALGFKEYLGISDYSGLIQKALIVSIVIWIIISAQIHLRNSVVTEKKVY